MTILDPAPARPLPRELLRNVTYLTPNQSEAALLLGKPEMEIDGFDAAREAARGLLELGPAAAVLKLGRQGCFVAANGFSGGVPGSRSKPWIPPPPEILSTAHSPWPSPKG